MYIQKIAIECFGSLRDVTYELKDGINLLEGPNECGKSTLAAFIKFIFYGLCGKMPDLNMTEKVRYTNWDNGISGGSLEIVTESGRYRIERRVVPAAKAGGKETLSMIDLDSGAPYRKGECPGEVFFGVSEDVFAQTAFSAQGSASLVDAEKMNTAIDNLLFSGNESVSVKKALKKLDDARIFLLHKNRKGGKLYTLDQEIEALEERIRKAEESETVLEAKNRTLSESRAQLEQSQTELKLLNDKLEHDRAARILARFHEMDTKKEEFLQKQREAHALLDASRVNGFLPDGPFTESLRRLYTDIGIAENERDSLTRQKNAFTQTTLTPSQNKVLSAIQAHGGHTQAHTAVKKGAEKKKSLRKATLLCSCFCVLLALFTLLFGFVGLFNTFLASSPARFLLLALTVLSLLLPIGLGSGLGAKSVLSLYAAFDGSNEGEAHRNIDAAMEAEKAVRESNERYAHLCLTLDSCQERLKNAYAEATALLSRWGLPCSSRDSLKEGEEKAQRVLNALSHAELAVREAKMAYDTCSAALTGYDRQEEQAHFEQTAYVGDVKEAEIEALKRYRSFYDKKARALEEQIRALELEIASLSAITESTDPLHEALTEYTERRKEYTDKYQAYLLAYDTIRKAGETLRDRIAPALAADAGAMMKDSTDGRYTHIGVDNALSLSFRDSEASPTREIAFLSAGTRALTYISLRLALIRLLFNGKMPPLIFDEAFSYLDDDRLARTMALLSRYAASSQILILTCCDREYHACCQTQTPHRIRLKGN